MGDVQLCGINSRYWRDFLKMFQEGATDEQARAALQRLRRKVGGVADIPKQTATSALAIVGELESLLNLTN